VTEIDKAVRGVIDAYIALEAADVVEHARLDALSESGQANVSDGEHVAEFARIRCLTGALGDALSLVTVKQVMEWRESRSPLDMNSKEMWVNYLDHREE